MGGTDKLPAGGGWAIPSRPSTSRVSSGGRGTGTSGGEGGGKGRADVGRAVPTTRKAPTRLVTTGWEGGGGWVDGWTDSWMDAWVRSRRKNHKKSTGRRIRAG